MNKQIAQIIDKAIDGEEISAPELRSLLDVDYLSEESYIIQYAARKVASEAAHGKAEVHAQVGMNVGPCPKDCQFCSFAPVNKIFPKQQEFSLEEIIQKALRLEGDGASAIYLMTTAAYDLARYIEVAKEVRAALKTETPMVANVDDFDEDGASALKKVGFAGVYHVVRLGEGVVTRIDPALRLKTIAFAQKAGLLVGTCVEPVGPEHTPDEIAERTMLAKSFHPVHGGSGRRMRIPGSPLEAKGTLTKARERLVVAATKLAFGYSIAGHAGINLSWAESGSNPRDTKADTVIGATVATRRKELEEEGWEVLAGPSLLFAQN